MDHLRRELAPISEAAWALISQEANRTLRHFLAARPLVDFSGPLGWGHSAQNLGRTDEAPAPADGVVAARRRVLPLVELRTAFELSLAELDDVERGSQDPDLSAVVQAARRAALVEDRAIFHGFPAGGIVGIAGASPYEKLPISSDYNQYPSTVARAVAVLRNAGIAGPYGIALGPRCYTGVIETTERGGYPVLEHIRLILGGPVLWAPGVDGALVISLRGGDYVLTCGQDFSLGYAGHTSSLVSLYLEESIAFEVRDERAALALVYQA